MIRLDTSAAEYKKLASPKNKQFFCSSCGIASTKRPRIRSCMKTVSGNQDINI